MSDQRTALSRDALKHAPAVPQFVVSVVDGADGGRYAEAVDGKVTVGTGERVDLQLTDPKVSRFHVEFQSALGGVAVHDLGSTNGTVIAGVVVREAFVSADTHVLVGETRLRLEMRAPAQSETAPTQKFGSLVGTSESMQAIFRVLRQAAPTQSPILITGESGTGKELAARAVHDASPRAQQPFEVVDCGGLPPTLIESELFGHERGAFTGAVGTHEGAFERANGGTLFLDELGEMPIEVQPKLLRALGEGEVRRLGARKTQQVDVRIVAATNRDLRREVNEGRFRADLFYRLAVIQVRMPSLRERLDDLPRLAAALLAAIAKQGRVDRDATSLLDSALLATLRSHTWPGNVRELRNYLEQLLVLEHAPPLQREAASDIFAGLETLSMPLAKQQLLERFDRTYVAAILERTKGNVAEAARLANVDRRTLFRIIERYGLRR